MAASFATRPTVQIDFSEQRKRLQIIGPGSDHQLPRSMLTLLPGTCKKRFLPDLKRLPAKMPDEQSFTFKILKYAKLANRHVLVLGMPKQYQSGNIT
jgi:hypothetical protein